jgi:hypothetical protein
MNSIYPIVKIDATTVKEVLPIFINRGIFSNYDSLPERADLLNRLKLDLNVTELTKEQERDYLTQIGEYKAKDYVVRDYGSYIIAFSLKAYRGDIQDGLKRAKLNRLGHKIAMLILSEVYIQRKLEGLTIPVQKIVEQLGYTTADKSIYGDISDVMFSLRYLDFEIVEYKTNLKLTEESRTTGNFIYTLRKDGTKSYTIWVNPIFVGSIVCVLADDKNLLPDNAFERGYLYYPTALLPLSRNYSQGAYLLTHFLMAELGNSKLNTSTHKVIAQKVSKLMEIMKINYSREDRNYQAFLNALEETQIIDQVDPDISTLKNIKTSRRLDQVVHLYVKKNIEQLNSEIKSNLLVTKSGKK